MTCDTEIINHVESDKRKADDDLCQGVLHRAPDEPLLLRRDA
jgi:hypothetical protein